MRPASLALVRGASGPSFDREEAFEADMLVDRHDVDEAGPLHHVEVALRRERLQHALQAAGLVDDLGLG